ncbi:MAG: NAD-dependent epimerase/dehydratase family protein [Gemmatimonadales bacterium]|nr:MAG: NAD-dependent epimerase/dehydratase family protein [Gemmatimonadales bacterium]
MHVVFGASGALGSRVVARLLAAGEPVRAVSRAPGRIAGQCESGAEGVTADLRDPESLPPALAGARSLVLAAHGLVPPSRGNHPGEVDGPGARAAIDAAVQAGVRRIIHLSVPGAHGDATAFGRVKRATERHLEASGVPFTILRPTLFMENHALVLLGEPLRRGAKVDFFGAGTTPLNWVSADDVAGWVADAALDPDRPSETLEVGGPEVMTRRDALGVLEIVLGREARRRHLPLPVVQGVRWTVGVVHPGVRFLLDLVLAEERGRLGPPPTPSELDRSGMTQLEELASTWAQA